MSDEPREDVEKSMFKIKGSWAFFAALLSAAALLRGDRLDGMPLSFAIFLAVIVIVWLVYCCE